MARVEINVEDTTQVTVTYNIVSVASSQVGFHMHSIRLVLQKTTISMALIITSSPLPILYPHIRQPSKKEL